jgi:hypothetical protein
VASAPTGPFESPGPTSGVATAVADDDREPTRRFLAAAYVFGALAGLALGVYGVFLVPAGPRPGGTLFSVGLALAVFGNAGLAALVRWWTGTRLGALIPLVGWVPVVLLFGTTRAEGDLGLEANTTGYLFLIMGAFIPVIVAMIGRPRRGLSAFPSLPVPPSGRRP